MTETVNGWTNEDTYLAGVLVINDEYLASLGSRALDADDLKDTLRPILLEEETERDDILGLRRDISRHDWENTVDWEDIFNSLD